MKPSLERENDHFAALIEHDLGAPVRAVVEFSHLLQGEYGASLDDNARLYLSFIVNNGEKLRSMIVGLGRLRRIDVPAAELSHTDCNAILAQCLDRLRPVIEAQGAEVIVTDLPPALANAKEIEEIFSELLDNSLKFVVQGRRPRICVRGVSHDGIAEYSISDNGIGMDARFYEKVFQPFTKLNIDSLFPGIGMGLCLVKRMVEAHNGQVTLESEVGNGTTVRFTIATENVPSNDVGRPSS